MCNDSSKARWFASKQDAKHFLRQRDRKARLRVYFCPDCEVWRLTSRRKRLVKRANELAKPEPGAPNGQSSEPRKAVQTMVTVPTVTPATLNR